MANQISTTARETAAIVPEVWSAKFYQTLLAELPFNALIDKTYTGDISALGDVVHISEIPEFADIESELPEGAVNDADSVTIKGYPLTINRRVPKDYLVTKKSELQSLTHMDRLRDRAIYAIMKRIQRLIINIINPEGMPIALSSNSLSIENLIAGKGRLDNRNVPLQGRYGVFEPVVYNSVLSLAGFTSRDYVPAGSPLSGGSLTVPVLGFDLKMTTELSSSYLFHPSFATLALQQDLSIGVFNTGVDGLRGTRVNVDVLLGLRQMDSNRIVELA